eukprot:Nk52_evm1s2276 gene=Nk52_evmTU1s2276
MPADSKKKSKTGEGVTSYMDLDEKKTIKGDNKEKEEKKELTPEEIDLQTVNDIKQNVGYLIKAVSTREARFVSRVLRTISTLRKKLNANVLKQALASFVPANSEQLLASVGKYVSSGALIKGAEKAPVKFSSAHTIALPEVEAYMQLLVVIYLIDLGMKKESLECCESLIKTIRTYNRRTFDGLSAKCYFYYSLCHERCDRLAEIRPLLHDVLRTATLNHDEACQATLINLLLRNYLKHNLYEQADKLVSKSVFPASANNNELARHMFYLGMIRAIQLDYSESHNFIIQAIRKAPETAAVGFQQCIRKLEIIVQLLLGEIPDRSTFRMPMLRKALQPYLLLTQTVRNGDLTAFADVLNKYRGNFVKDGTYTLILRLRHNVIKTGIRMISLSYSKISLRDICTKLHLDSPEDAEYIVAKSIRDGVINAVIDHVEGCVNSKENVDIYSTNEPQAAYDHRINFCLKTYNESVMAMRFPPNAFRKELESAEQRREREQQEKEIAEEMADPDSDDDEMDF